jgi:predicted O-methyltransferase YrrM
MSATSTVLDTAHFKYIAEHTTGDDDFLIRLKQAASTDNIPAIWISPEQASFMQVLLKLSRAQDVIEVGTLAGYSAISMARALGPNGHIRSIELNPVHAEFAKRWIDDSDVAGRIEVLTGSGQDILPGLADDSADAAFLDADKAGYAYYLGECQRIVRAGGLIMVDNAFAFGQLLDPEATDDSVKSVRAFNEMMAKASWLHSIIVPIGDGLWVGVKNSE